MKDQQIDRRSQEYLDGETAGIYSHEDRNAALLPRWKPYSEDWQRGYQKGRKQRNAVYLSSDGPKAWSPPTLQS